MSDGFRYAAFISYSSRDASFAQRLHRALESYGIPSALGKFDLLGGGGKPNRIYPVFRDREELAAGDLGERIEASLKSSAALIVVCSPNAAASPWVQKEIEFFVSRGRADKVFAIISPDAPQFDAAGADATPGCFPPAFRGDALAGQGSLEPLAADARKGKDGFRNAWLKIVAGMVGVTPGQLIDRDRIRRGRQRLMAAGGVAAGVLAAAIPIAWQTAVAWRTDLTSRAVQMSKDGDRAGALTLALAGMDLGGAVLPARAQNAEEALKDLAGMSLRAVVDPESDFVLSTDGAVLLTRDPGGTITAHDLEGGSAPRMLGQAEGDRQENLKAGFPMYWAPDAGGGWIVLPVRDARIIRLAELRAPAVMTVKTNVGVQYVAVDADGAAHVFDVAKGRDRLLALDGKVTWMSTTYPLSGVWLQTAAGTIYVLEAARGAEPKVVGKLPPADRIDEVSGPLLFVVDRDGGLSRIDMGGKLPPAKVTGVDTSFDIELDTYRIDDVATQFVARMTDGGYAVIDVATGAARRLSMPRGAALLDPEFQFAPDRRGVAAHSRSDGALWYFDLASRAPGVKFGSAGAESEPTFSDVGRLYLHQGTAEDEVVWYAAGPGAPRLGGSLTTPGALLSPDETLILQRAGGELRMQRTDLSASAVSLGPVGEIVNGDFSGDRSILLWERSGALYRYDLDARTRKAVVRTAPVSEGQDYDFDFTSDRAWLVVMDSAGSIWSVDTSGKRDARRLTSAADPASFISLTDGSTLFDVRMKSGETNRYDAADGALVPPPARGPPPPVAVAGLMPEQDAAGVVGLRRTDTKDLAVSLGTYGPMGAMALSADGSVLAAQQKDGALWIIDVKTPDKRRNLVEEFPDVSFLSKQPGFSEVSTFYLSPDGGAVVVRVRPDALTFLNLRHGGPPVAIGRLSFDDPPFAFSQDGGKILVGKKKERRSVYDLKAQPAAQRLAGSALANEVCRQSGDALSPLPASVRDPELKGRATADQATYDALRGRPWNPCDWRGFFAILPDAQGGGWFEGPTQWLRLTTVRMGLAKDYSCGETVSGAGDSRAARRLAACSTGASRPAAPS